MDQKEITIRHINRYEGILVNVALDSVALPDGRSSMREIVEHPGGVGILPVDAEGFAYCVRQYRYAFGESLLEIPAGKLEIGEDPLECAVRELSEETGFTAGKMVELGKAYTSPGYCREVLYLYLALDLRPGNAHPDSGEFVEVERLPMKKLAEMVLSGELSDAKTLIAVLKAEQLLKEGYESQM